MQTAELFTWDDLRARALARDGHRCVIGRLFGGTCHPTLDVHHVTPITEGGDPLALANVVTVCHSHHPVVERLRREFRAEVGLGPCGHEHRYPQGAAECRRRRLRALAERRAA